jgi:signal transduction histidine kinase
MARISTVTCRGLRHSALSPVRVRIAVSDGRLALEVTNPLIGPTIHDEGGTGLRGIRERAGLLGGHAQAGPHGDSWRVFAQLPLHRNGLAFPESPDVRAVSNRA